jgi:hypothetical protein
MKNNNVKDSFNDAGGLIFAFFCTYVIAFGAAWYCGSKKRETLRRDAVDKQIARERALQALQNIE